MMTSAMLASRLNSISCSEARMVPVRSLRTESFTEGGSHSRRRGISARIASVVAIMFAPACLRIMMRTARSELNHPIWRTFSLESTAWPIAPSVMEPVGFCATTMSR